MNNPPDNEMARRLGVSSEVLRRDRELYDFSQAHPRLTVEQIREWCENGEIAANYPTLPELFSCMSDAEIKEWCEGGELVEEYLAENADLPDSYWGLPEDEVQELREHGEYHRGPIPSLELPPDPGLKLRQLRALLGDEIEFRTRYPDAYRLLFAPPHPDSRKDIGGLYLPTFDCRIARSASQAGAVEDWGSKLTDAYSATSDIPESERPVDQTFLPLDPSHLRGILLAILGREEYAERVDPPGGRERELLLKGVGAPGREAVRLTDLRLAADLMHLKPEELQGRLRSLLEDLKRPVTPDRVIRWKRQTLKKHGDTTVRGVGEPDTAALIASFTAAALCLFVDLDMPGVRGMTVYRLAEKVEGLANIVSKEMTALDASAKRLQVLVAERPAGGQRHPDARYLRALRMHRMGTDKANLAESWGITPYRSNVTSWSRDWPKKVARILARGLEVEKERYPQAAAIFENRDHPSVLRKARLAYEAYTAETGFGFRANADDLNERHLWSIIGTGIRINTRSSRGRQIAMAYVQLGSCIARGISPLP